MPIFDSKTIIQALTNKTQDTLDLSGYSTEEKAELNTKALKTLTEHRDTVYALAVLPNGRFISGSRDNSIKMWNQQGQCIKTLTDHHYWVGALAVLPNGRFISGSYDKTIKLWDAQGKCLNTLTEHCDHVVALAVLPDGRFISGSADRTIKLWDQQGKCLNTLTEHKFGVAALAVFPDGRFISGSWDNSIKLWNQQGKCLNTLTGHSNQVAALAVLPDGRFISGAHEGIKLWNQQGQCINTLTEPPVDALAALPDGRFISGHWDTNNSIKLWSTHGKHLNTLVGHNQTVKTLAVLPDARFISGSDDSTINLWDGRQASVLRPLGFTDIAPLLAALAQHAHIQKLNLQKVQVTDNDVPALLKPLQLTRTLKQIDVRDTRISATGARILHQGLPGKQILHPAMAEILKLEQQAAALAEKNKQKLTEDALKQQQLLEAQKQIEQLQKQLAAAKINPSPSPAPVPAKPSASDLGSALTASYAIPFQELTLIEERGKGGFGVVYRATWRHREVAVKQLLNTKLTAETLAEFKAESQVMMRLRSPDIVQFYGYCLSPQYCLVMEYMPKGSLFEVLHSQQPLTWHVRYQIATDMACGLAFLHREGILHRDVKSLNVLINDQFRAKLTDFGLARVKSETQTTSTKGSAGTPAWMAPELFKRKANYTQKCDVYSLGIAFWELAARKRPFEDASNPAVIPSWIMQGERDDIPADCPKGFAKLIQSCWGDDAKTRPTADEVVALLKKNQAEDLAGLPAAVATPATASTTSTSLGINTKGRIFQALQDMQKGQAQINQNIAQGNRQNVQLHLAQQAALDGVADDVNLLQKHAQVQEAEYDAAIAKLAP
jgi:WD40 repeat protein/serine/threonine protein kinase